jgi:hypothetical protein
VDQSADKVKSLGKLLTAKVAKAAKKEDIRKSDNRLVSTMQAPESQKAFNRKDREGRKEKRAVSGSTGHF